MSASTEAPPIRSTGETPRPSPFRKPEWALTFFSRDLYKSVFFCPPRVPGGVFIVMLNGDTNIWLKEFAEQRSETAFRKVVTEHSGIVIGTAMRLLNGDRSTSEEVMQEVFIQLAKKARALSSGKVTLSAWLYRQTCRIASNRVRTEVRRRKREEVFEVKRESRKSNEREVIEEIDHALGELSKSEAELVICRYVEEQDYADIGNRLGTSGEAARKKTGRAVEKLRLILERRGLGVSTSALGVILLGLSGPKASANTVALITNNALVKGAGTNAGLFSVGGILAGAMSVSVVMGGARIMETPVAGSQPIADAQRSTRPSSQSTLDRLQADGRPQGNLSEEEIWKYLIELDQEPKSEATNLMVQKVLQSVSDDRLMSFMGAANRHVSVVMVERIAYPLATRATEIAPRETIEELLDKDMFTLKDPRVNYSGRLGPKLVMAWSDTSLDEASTWLTRNWETLQGFKVGSSTPVNDFTSRRATERRNYSMADNLGRAMAFKIYHSRGLEEAKQFIDPFDDNTKVALWKGIFTRNHPRLQAGDLYPAKLAEFLVTFPDEEPFGEMKEVTWLSWMKASDLTSNSWADRNTDKKKYHQALPPGFAADFKKSCLDEIPKGGQQ